MAIMAKHKETLFGVGDVVSVGLIVNEGEKTRRQNFEGVVIAIKGRGTGKSFTVRRIGIQQVGIERIFPLGADVVESVDVIRKGSKGVRRAKLYYIRNKSKREIEKIYSRNENKSSKIK